MLVTFLKFLSFYPLHLLHSVVALAAGSLLHVSLKSLWLRIKARGQQAVASIR